MLHGSKTDEVERLQVYVLCIREIELKEAVERILNFWSYSILCLFKLLYIKAGVTDACLVRSLSLYLSGNTQKTEALNIGISR